MLVLFSLSFAVLFSCMVYISLSTMFSKQIRLEKRLRSTEGINSHEINYSELNSSFSDRLIKPVFTKLLNLFSMFVPQNSTAQEKLTQQLMQAGIHMTAQNYNAAVMLFSVACVLLALVYGILLKKTVFIIALLGVFGFYAGVIISRFYLKRKIKQRKEEMYHQLPDMLDLLSVSVAAGLGFDQALSYVVKKSKGALIEELDIAQREILLGRSRKESLGRFADRCDSQEISTFVSAVVQADEMGSSMQNILQIQASTIRLSHKQNVEEKAQKLSVKILFPMTVFIFPVMFIVLLGPSVPQIIQVLGGI